ncbi:MAG: penicillin-binding transpeptidase domain-containing protein, partial [Chloroflexi bacterium]|nr:penicillin-binding transpeptidase domain-containing protein [Chloroflexota bacterium]
MKRGLMLCLLLGLALAGCNLHSGPDTPEPSQTLPTPVMTNVAAPDPEIAARLFLDAWKRDDLAAMYAMLSPLSQDSLTEEEFTAFYAEVKQAAALASLDYQITSALVNPREAQVSYRITLTSTVVGDVVRDTYLSLTGDAGEWKVAWAPTTILPELKDGTSLYLDVVTPTRANIYDRNGLALAVQADTVGVYIVPNRIGDENAEKTMLIVLGRLFDRSTSGIQALYESFRGTDYLIPLGEVALEDFQQIEGTLSSVGGTGWDTYTGRYYPLGEYSSQAVGYVAQITKEQVEEYRQSGYAGDEFVGQTGLEYVFENELRGQPGGTLSVRDASGQVLTPLASRDPGVPQAVTTTLDRNLQLETQQAIEGLRGAIVVLERDTGRVLAIASSPSFNPNLFNASNPNSSAGLTELFQRNDYPFLDRGTESTYPLGSVFKIITMSAALETKAFTPDSEYTCTNYFEELPGWVGEDWTVVKELKPHGTLTLMQGLERSCNPWFWHIGYQLFNLGFPTALSDMAKGFGLGQAAGIEIGDKPGLVPDPEWTLANLGREWNAGDSVQLAIGQASLGVTPLQVARFVAAVGNGGTLYQPQMVETIQTAEGVVSRQFAVVEQGKLPVSAENLAFIQQAMTQVVREPKGTAYRRFLGLNIDLAGKTGSATSGEGTESHAWFAGYTFRNEPEKPDIAVVVLAEYQ